MIIPLSGMFCLFRKNTSKLQVKLNLNVTCVSFRMSTYSSYFGFTGWVNFAYKETGSVSLAVVTSIQCLDRAT